MSHCHDSSSAQLVRGPFEQQILTLSSCPSHRTSPNPSPTPIIPGDSFPEHTGRILEIIHSPDYITCQGEMRCNDSPKWTMIFYDLFVCKQAYRRELSKEQRQQREKTLKEKEVAVRVVSKLGRKNAKGDGFKAKNCSKFILKDHREGFEDKVGSTLSKKESTVEQSKEEKLLLKLLQHPLKQPLLFIWEKKKMKRMDETWKVKKMMDYSSSFEDIQAKLESRLKSWLEVHRRHGK
ncbi:hypothetical protein Tco_0861317 [Tanacetum coccineum]|uniref:Uncharacterized protein n=1 Tax=Tanacetum coccineum TaxID=301880 RepID=A0ABQ5BHF7_9ASTR